MSHKQAIDRGVELLTLCQQLQSERDGVPRPAPGDFDKTKVLDAFAQDVMQSISYMTALYALMPMKSKLADLGREFERQGKIALDGGADYAQAALDHVMAGCGLSESATSHTCGEPAGEEAAPASSAQKAMQIAPHAGGRLQLTRPQMVWVSQHSGGVLDSAVFAGQELIAITDDAGGFDVTYLGFQACGFPTMEAAKAAAPEFARQVLARMSKMISDGVDG